MMRSQWPTLPPVADYETLRNCEWRKLRPWLFPLLEGKSTSRSLKRPRPKVAAGGASYISHRQSNCYREQHKFGTSLLLASRANEQSGSEPS